MPGDRSLATHAASTGRRFICRPRPARDEHVLSYLLRLGVMNGYSGHPALGRFVRSIQASLCRADEVATVAQLVDLDVCILHELLGRHRRVPGVRTSSLYWATHYFFRDPYIAYCPACIGERGLFRAIWNFRAIAICELHCVWLVERCPQCTELVGWDRPGPTSCKCGFDLGQTETTPAPIEAALISKQISAAVLEVAETDLIEQQLFCTKVRRMSPLEWLAVSNFLSTIVTRSHHFHPTTKSSLETEKRATILAAELLRASPTSAMHELNRISQSHLVGWKPLLISFEKLIARAPTRYLNRRRGAMALPAFLTELVHQYVDDLTVYREGRRFAVNPDRLEAGSDGSLAISIRRATSIGSSEARSQRESISLGDLIQAIRQMNIVLHSTREAEELIGATSRQRLALIRVGLLHRFDGSTFVLSSEIDRFLRWLRDNSTLTTDLSSMVRLSELTPMSCLGFQRVMTAVIEKRVRLFRRVEDSVTFGTCFVAKRSLATLVR
ncbi:TniQ protein [Paraburkholderia sp. RAU2J]|nr:TniQ protein [Paraburkholderia sp. RAU2J]